MANALRAWWFVLVAAACGGSRQGPPGDCEVVRTHWKELSSDGDDAAIQRVYEVCVREKFGAAFTDCLRAARDANAGRACFHDKLNDGEQAALRAAHDAATGDTTAPPPRWPRSPRA